MCSGSKQKLGPDSDTGQERQTRSAGDVFCANIVARVPGVIEDQDEAEAERAQDMQQSSTTCRTTLAVARLRPSCLNFAGL
jgi:hypothetical protein